MKKKRKSFILVIATLILSIALTCCVSTPKVDELKWSEPPSPDRNGETIIIFDSETNTVSMPLYYWIELIEYISDTETNKELLKVKEKS